MRLALIILLFLFCMQPVGLADTPDPYTWDFGTVKEGRVLEHEFTFTNSSLKAIKIESVYTSCGCTASQVQKKSLAPGESTAIKVQFKSHGYAGAVEQFIYVNTDDIDNPVIRFIIKAEVIK